LNSTCAAETYPAELNTVTLPYFSYCNIVQVLDYHTHLTIPQKELTIPQKRGVHIMCGLT